MPKSTPKDKVPLADKIYNGVWKLRVIAKEYTDDPETAHLHADRILCEVLVDLGCTEVVEEWNKIPKHYA